MQVCCNAAVGFPEKASMLRGTKMELAQVAEERQGPRPSQTFGARVTSTRLSASPKQSQKHLQPSLPSCLLAAGAQGDMPAATPLERSNGAVVADGIWHAPARRRIRMMPASFRPVVCT